MNDKIWFVYLTDHHEGPFTPQEVAEKVQQGVVTPQSLGWKDGMAEWVPMDTIPELQAAISAIGGATAAPAAEAPAGGDEGFSLAQLLASQQTDGGAGTAPASQDSPGLNVAGDGDRTDPGIVTAGTGGGGTSPGPNDEVWTLRVGDQVSGMHSLNRLKALAGEGEIPADAMLWRSGWSDFQSIAAVPEVASARRSKRLTGQTNTGTGVNTNTGIRKMSGLAPITAGANVGNDEATDPNIQAPAKGIKGILQRISGLLKRRPAATKAAPAASLGKTNANLQFGKIKARSGGGMARRIATILLPILLVAGAGGAYFVFFSSPIPSDLDVLPDDLETMQAVVKNPEGKQLVLAVARGTEDAPADDLNPKFYVATNAAPGTSVAMKVTGRTGTLVNRVSFEKTFTAAVNKKHLAVFDQIQDEGKPLPMGIYSVELKADGVEPLVTERFLGGRKGPAYDNRLKKYKDKVQADYDAEMQQLSQFVTTLKSTQAEVSKKIAENKAALVNPANKAKTIYDWRTFAGKEAPLIADLDSKLKARAAATDQQMFNPRLYQDVTATLTQLQQLLQGHGQRVESAAPAGVNLDELEGLLQAGVLSLEQSLAQAMMKSPFELLGAQGGAATATTGSPSSSSSPSPAPSAAPITAPAAPAAN